MLFKFLKYISPTNYFNLVRRNGTTIFPIYKALPIEIKSQLPLDEQYQSDIACELDASWRALQKGYIGEVATLDFVQNIPLVDEYVFIRKYYNPLWVYYTFVLRLCLLNNPFKELVAILKTRKVKRTALYQSPMQYIQWDTFKSELVAKQPKVSVVIPTLNRYEYLKDVLLDLEQQNYTNFDVIVVDQSEPFQKEFYDTFNLKLKIINQEEKALWLARNTAIKTSNADFLLLFDDDSRVDSVWINNHLKCLDFFQADISSGTSISLVGAKVPENYAFFKVSEQLDTGNVLIKREVFKKIGLFDRQFEKQRMGDGEYGLRAFLAGYKNISNPFAERLHLKVGSGGLRQMGSWDGYRPKKWFGPRPIPSIVYMFRKYYGNKVTRFNLIKNVPSSLIAYKYKGNSKIMIIGYLITLLLFPLVFIQVYLSWRLATKKLKEGAKIENLEVL